MKFGIFLLNQWPLGEDMATKISEAVEQVRAAKEAGFDILATGQHYLSYPYQLPASIPFLSRLAAEAEGMVIAISNCGASSKNVLSWLDKARGCGANVYCDNGAATWSDVRISPNGQDV